MLTCWMLLNQGWGGVEAIKYQKEHSIEQKGVATMISHINSFELSLPKLPSYEQILLGTSLEAFKSV